METGKAATDREGDNMAAHTEGDVTRYDSQRGFLALQYFCDIVLTGYIVPALQRTVALKILVANRNV